MTRFLLTLLICVASFAASAQARLKLFIDCSQFYCDFDFIRQQIPVVDFVRDRKQADIHVLISSQSGGNGGRRYEAQFINPHKSDTLSFRTLPNSTDDDIRQQLAQVIKAGITMRLAANGQLDKLNISFVADTTGQNSNGKNKDKWNYWVFSIGGRANLSGDKNYKETYAGGNVSASRVTDKSKINFEMFASTDHSIYLVDDGSNVKKIKAVNESSFENFFYVKSISSKWSAASGVNFRKSTYENLKSSLTASAGAEYNIFPYKLSSSKFLVIRGTIEADQRRYLEETIYDKTKQDLISANIGVYASVTQSWGSISSYASYRNYLDDLSKNDLSFFASVSVKLFKGVSVNFYSAAGLINDQLGLPKGRATPDEILLRLKALSSSFNYETGFGVNYSFGSKLNNFVNSRFTSGRF